MNPERTRKIETLLGLLATQLIVAALLLYVLDEPGRIVAAQDQVLHTQLDQAMSLYAENCAVCHGLAGEGIGSIPALENEGLRSMPYYDLVRVIADGRYNTGMPAWSLENGGPLSDYQIGELVALILSGDWQATQERVVNLGLAPLVPFTTDPDPALLEQVTWLPGGETLQVGIRVYAAECIACHGTDGLGSAIAPALNEPLVRTRTVDELTRTIAYGSAGTLMAGWDGVLSPEEIAAAVALIQRWDEIPSGTLPAPEAPVPLTAESLVLGSELYTASCARCHGTDGQGTMRAPGLNVRGFLTETSDPAIQQIVTLGVPGTSMPAWGDRMTEAEIQALVGFIRQWEPTAPEVAVPSRGAGGGAGAGNGRGGPPWLRDSAQATALPLPTPTQLVDPQPTEIPAVVEGSPTPTSIPAHTPGAEAQTPGGGNPPWAQAAAEPAAALPPLDWRILALVGGGLAIASTLILIGYTALKRPRR
ncbi:MAG: c-type cytochrome [Anaerolineales bacterium]|nr:c-type cytochrome [Anaerolineales bacterium]